MLENSQQAVLDIFEPSHRIINRKKGTHRRRLPGRRKNPHDGVQRINMRHIVGQTLSEQAHGIRNHRHIDRQRRPRRTQRNARSRRRRRSRTKRSSGTRPRRSGRTETRTETRRCRDAPLRTSCRRIARYISCPMNMMRRSERLWRDKWSRPRMKWRLARVGDDRTAHTGNSRSWRGRLSKVRGQQRRRRSPGRRRHGHR